MFGQTFPTSLSGQMAQQRIQSAGPYQGVNPRAPSSQGANGPQGPQSPGGTQILPTGGGGGGWGSPGTQDYYPSGQTPQLPSGGSSGGTPVLPNGMVGPAPPAAPRYEAPQLPNTPLPTYTAAQIGQFKDPTNQAIGGAANDLMLRVLQRPESMDPLTVQMMQEQQKEAQLQALGLSQQNFRADALGRGMIDSGATAAGQRRLTTDTLGNIFKGNRDINIAAAQTNMQDRLNALSTSDMFQTGTMNRGVSGYGAQLSGQQAQAGENRFQQQSEADAVNFALQRAIQQAQLAQPYNALNENARQYDLGYGMDTARLQMDQQEQMLRYLQALGLA